MFYFLSDCRTGSRSVNTLCENPKSQQENSIQIVEIENFAPFPDFEAPEVDFSWIGTEWKQVNQTVSFWNDLKEENQTDFDLFHNVWLGTDTR